MLFISLWCIGVGSFCMGIEAVLDYVDARYRRQQLNAFFDERWALYEASQRRYITEGGVYR